jgi:CHRD domain
MRRLALFAVALALGAPACDDDNPVGPSNAGPIVFTSELRASNEVAPNTVTNAESGAQGTVTITFSVPRDGSGNVTGDGVWNVQAVISGFVAGSAIRAAHIHNGAAGVNAGVFVDTLQQASNPVPITDGSATINYESVRITQLQAQAVMNNPAGHYFNMHSLTNPGGVIRGQLVRVR